MDGKNCWKSFSRPRYSHHLLNNKTETSSNLHHVIAKKWSPRSCFGLGLDSSFQTLPLKHHFNFTFSISMTTCSTVAALGMMPLCLYLYTLSWNLEQNLTIPYQNIGLYWAWKME